MIEALVRCCVFGFVGPIAGLLTLIILGGGSQNLVLDTLIIVLLFVYLFGLVPALLAAAFDEFLDRRGAKGIPKYLLTGGFGYVVAYLVPLTPLLLYQPRWGLIGATSAAICSWITDKMTNLVSRESARTFRRTSS